MKIVNVMKAFYDGSKYHVRQRDELTEAFEIVAGVKQGMFYPLL